MLYKITCIFALYLLWVIFTEKHEIQHTFVTSPASHCISNLKPIVQPDDYSCGPQSCQIVLEYYGIKKNMSELRRTARTDFYYLTTPKGMVDCLMESGLEAEISFGNLNHLKHLISCNNPPIVLVSCSENRLHYLIGAGYTETSIIFINVGSGKMQEINNDIFLAAWNFEADIYGEKFPNSLMKKALGWSGISGNLLIAKK